MKKLVVKLKFVLFILLGVFISISCKETTSEPIIQKKISMDVSGDINLDILETSGTIQVVDNGIEMKHFTMGFNHVSDSDYEFKILFIFKDRIPKKGTYTEITTDPDASKIDCIYVSLRIIGSKTRVFEAVSGKFDISDISAIDLVGSFEMILKEKNGTGQITVKNGYLNVFSPF